MRERRVHLERLARLLQLLLLAEVLDRAQVVQAVGQLDEDDAQVLRHRDDQLPVVLRLRMLAALELDARQLRHTLDELGDLFAELGAQLIDVGRGVLDDVMEERGRKRRLVELQAGEDLRGSPGVVDELLARLAHLPRVRLGGVVERPDEQVPVYVGLVRLDLGEQFLDEVLMSVEYCHTSSVSRGVVASSPIRAQPLRRKTRCADERLEPYVRPSPTDQEARADRPDAPGARRREQPPCIAAPHRARFGSSAG